MRESLLSTILVISLLSIVIAQDSNVRTVDTTNGYTFQKVSNVSQINVGRDATLLEVYHYGSRQLLYVEIRSYGSGTILYASNGVASLDGTNYIYLFNLTAGNFVDRDRTGDYIVVISTNQMNGVDTYVGLSSRLTENYPAYPSYYSISIYLWPILAAVIIFSVVTSVLFVVLCLRGKKSVAAIGESQKRMRNHIIYTCIACVVIVILILFLIAVPWIAMQTINHQCCGIINRSTSTTAETSCSGNRCMYDKTQTVQETTYILWVVCLCFGLGSILLLLVVVFVTIQAFKMARLRKSQVNFTPSVKFVVQA
ncbi:Ano6 [Acrasis kona]|uniref:Ano6 n=1 Tax=Acrasis kona TaxID=1008807 RepID=A0AAW2ZM07_9EUKA